MKSLYDFIVKPVGEKYNNTVRIGDKDLVVNTKIENWKFVNRIAEVIETPLAFNSNIEKGNLVVIHQNVFRTFYDMITIDKERSLVGILKYGNKSLEALEINPGDLVGYTPNGEWEFLVDNKRLYCMKSNDIVIKYEHQGNEEEYNPRWAQSS